MVGRDRLSAYHHVSLRISCDVCRAGIGLIDIRPSWRMLRPPQTVIPPAHPCSLVARAAMADLAHRV
jgi:hypothetical protein